MADNKTQPTTLSIDVFLAKQSTQRQAESRQLIDLLRSASGKDPVMWGTSIIGFGTKHYKYPSGREGDMPQIGFSPRKTALTFYLGNLNRFDTQFAKLGPYKTGVGCLYIKNLADIQLPVLTELLTASFQAASQPEPQISSVKDYIAQVPPEARPQFDALRAIVTQTLPHANEIYNYGIIGYKVDAKRARVFVSGWKNHVAMYPVPKDPTLQEQLKPYIKGKGTLWFALDKPLPADLIKSVALALAA